MTGAHVAPAPLEDVDRVVDVIRQHPRRGPLLTTLGVAQAAGFMALPRGPLSDYARVRTLNALRAAQADGLVVEAGMIGGAYVWDVAPGYLCPHGHPPHRLCDECDVDHRDTPTHDA